MPNANIDLIVVLLYCSCWPLSQSNPLSSFLADGFISIPRSARSSWITVNFYLRSQIPGAYQDKPDSSCSSIDPWAGPCPFILDPSVGFIFLVKGEGIPIKYNSNCAEDRAETWGPKWILLSMLDSLILYSIKQSFEKKIHTRESLAVAQLQ